MADTEMVDAPAEEEFNLSEPGIADKFSVAGDISTQALQAVIAAVAPGKRVVDLCSVGDDYIKLKTKDCFKSSKIEKGIAFPTCISVNHCCGHYSPLQDESIAVNEGDVVKIDLGVHIDGYISLAAHTVVVGATEPITGRKADVIAAAHTAAEVVLRAIKPGVKNTHITQLVERTVAAFHCEPLEGVVSQQLKKFLIEGQKCFLNKTQPEKRVVESVIQENEVYAIDIVVSSGEGRARELDSRVTVFKRSPNATYALKLKASRALFHDIKENHPHLPFSLREFESQRAKMGVVECVKHDLLQPYPVLYEREGEFVAQIKFTVLVLASGTRRISGGLPLQPLVSEHKVEDEEIKAILASRAGLAKKKKKKPTAAAAGAEGGASA